MMNNKEISARLREILAKADVDIDGVVNRKKSPQHEDDIEILLAHVAILISDLRLDAEASRRELFAVRQLLEE